MLREDVDSQWERISLIAEKQKYHQYLGKRYNTEQESEGLIKEKGRDNVLQFIYKIFQQFRIYSGFYLHISKWQNSKL